MKQGGLTAEKALENRIRLEIMSVLMIHEQQDFQSLKKLLELTDGNLATHLRYLENAQCLVSKKSFVGRRPQTQYRITTTGRDAFRAHLDNLERILGRHRPPGA